MNLIQEIALKWPNAFSQDEGTNSSEDTEKDKETKEDNKEEITEETTEENKEDNKEQENNEGKKEQNNENNEEEEEDNEQDNEEEEKEEIKPKKKRKSNVPKLLSERKELKTIVGELKTEIDWLKEWLSKVEDWKYYQTEKSNFINKFPNSKEHLEEIEKVKQKFPEMSFEYAYRIVSPESFVKWNSNPNIKWYTPDNLKEWKSYNKMSTSELKAEVQKGFEEWKFKLFS